MKNIIDRWSLWSPYLQSLLRTIARFHVHVCGYMELFAFPIGIPPNGGTVPLLSQIGLAGGLETFGAIKMVLSGKISKRLVLSIESFAEENQI